MSLPLSYTLNAFYKHAGSPRFKKHQNVYNASCPICHEGKSFGRKKRCYYIVNEDYIACHNCQRTWTPINWIKEVSGMSIAEILKESSEYSDGIEEVIQRNQTKEVKHSNLSTLPLDCINLTDAVQLAFYKDNQVVKDILAYLEKRRLLTATNRPRTFYVSLNDKFHRNRLIIPFFNERGKIIFYQSRAIYEKDIDYARYLSKVDADFAVFGIDKIDPDCENIFLFEGPIDAMFVKNGIGIGGLSLSEKQEEQLEKYRLYQRVWVLDNQMDNKEVIKKYRELINTGQQVFICPDKFKEFKDLNELCVHYKLDQVSPKWISDNSFTGMQALLKLGI